MLDDGECAKAVHFQFVNPVGIIERSGPLQERHWLEIHHLPFTAFTRIMICGTHFGANSRIAGLLTGNWKAREIRPFALLRRLSERQPSLPISSQNLHNAGMSIVVFEGFHCGHADEDRIGEGLRLLFGKCGKFSGKVFCQCGHGVLAFPQ